MHFHTMILVDRIMTHAKYVPSSDEVFLVYVVPFGLITFCIVDGS